MKIIQSLIMSACFLLLSALSISAQQTDTRWQDITDPITLDNVSDVIPAMFFRGYRNPVISPDSRYLAMRYGADRIFLFDTYTGFNRSYVADFSSYDHVRSLHLFNADSSRLIFKSSPNTVRIVSTEDGSSRDVYFESSSGGRLVSITPDGSAAYIDGSFYNYYGYQGGTRWVALDGQNSVSSLSVIIAQSDDGRYGYRGNNILVDMASGESILEIRSLIPHITYHREEVLFAGDYLAVSTNYRDNDKQGVYIIDLETLEIAYQIDNYLRIKSYDVENNRLYLTLPGGSEDEVLILRMGTFGMYEYRLPLVPIPGVNSTLSIGVTTANMTVSFSDIVREEIVYEINMSPYYRPWVSLNTTPHINWSNDSRFIVIDTASGIVLYALNQWDAYSLPTVYGVTSETRNYPIEHIQTTICENGISSTMMQGQVIYVATQAEFGSSLELNLRSEPQGEVLTQVSSGEGLIVITPPVCDSDGFIWLGVQSLRDPSIRGWIIEAQDDLRYIYPLN